MEGHGWLRSYGSILSRNYLMAGKVYMVEDAGAGAVLPGNHDGNLVRNYENQ
jgi:hypothetical protein